ncbi:RNA polymerase sigma-70 factor, ECF subfamily [Paenibacillus algorifonticola]|uniref:RNA polymerase sigma-70 factor, ECF subfamily n=1 Tax=Paenibacillus algorifonticola TaxID=684063 RepID=A0A1I2ABZ7_9BACL|nr:RNA polymerase sigma factor SigJ [Paenibacillus algorifonticola]SFE41416.1 RNA polymerase sigma-70 factor, ECF subfamily [Paenibacillus algorifonticola]
MTELYERYKNLLFRLAYQLTGSVSDAEDAVQDVFIKLQRVDPERLQEPKAYLCKMITNHCYDLLKSARKRREQYIGPWLPEPMQMTIDDGFEAVMRSDLLSYAMLALLERLSPAERSVFVLREALSFDYAAIAEITGKSEMNCRKLLSRARGKMGVTEQELVGAGAVSDEWAQQFLSALSEGKVDTVLSMLAGDAVLLSDGGGKVSAAIRPIQTGEHVARFLLGIIRKEGQGENDGFKIEIAQLKGQTAIMFKQQERITSAVFLHIKNELLQNIYIIRNPDKLERMNEQAL